MAILIGIWFKHYDVFAFEISCGHGLSLSTFLLSSGCVFVLWTSHTEDFEVGFWKTLKQIIQRPYGRQYGWDTGGDSTGKVSYFRALRTHKSPRSPLRGYVEAKIPIS